jgi:dTDP-6-deoxy-L-talose 4-dehydrogenase (NAD+)
MDIAEVDDAFGRLGKPDVLLHLAWGGLPHYRSERHLDSELPRQIAFLDSCVRAGLRRLVVAGTCLEYGMQSGCLDEEMPTAPVTAYGHAKDRLRTHLEALAAVSGLELTWLRLFYLYGPGQAPTSLYSQLRAAIESGATEFPMSPGDQQRDFLPIETAAAGMSTLALDEPGAGIVNLCSGEPKTVVALVRQWLQDWGAELHLGLGAFRYPDYEPRAYWGSTRKLDALLGTK